MANSTSMGDRVPLFVVDRRTGNPLPPELLPEGPLARLHAGPLRFFLPFLVSSVAMVGLFWLLYALIHATTGAQGNSEILPTVDFVRLAKNFEIESRNRKPPPEMPDRPEAPPEVPVQQTQIKGPTNTNVAINMSLENSTQVKSNFGLSSTDGEYLPIVKVAPMYPARAQSQGIEGWVLVQFTVTESGSVINPVVIEAQPQGVFDEAAKKAVTKFKYKPRVENGRPIAVPNVQHLIRFELEK
ncbi:MAG TPA: TonB family protein [Solimonas sp.]